MHNKFYFGQFSLNISEIMNDREKIVLNLFVKNEIVRVLKKNQENCFRGSEVMVKIVVKIGWPSNFFEQFLLNI